MIVFSAVLYSFNYVGAGVVTSSLAYYYYITHLEETPITGRKRFTIISPKKIEKLSEIEFEKVPHTSSLIALV